MLFLEDENIARTPVPVTRRGRTVTINPLHLLVWVALTPRTNRPSPPADDTYFPSIVDTAFNDTVFLRRDHFNDWVASPLSAFPSAGEARPTYASGQQSPSSHRRHDGDLWLRPNRPGLAPKRIELNRGFILAGQDGPPVPLLGSRALHRAGAQLLADYGRQVFSLRPRPGQPRALSGLWLESNSPLTRDQLIAVLRAQTVRRAVSLGQALSPEQACLVQLLRLCCGGPGSLLAEAEELALLSAAEANGLRTLLRELSNASQNQETRLGQLVVEAGYLPETQVQDALQRFEALFPTPR